MIIDACSIPKNKIIETDICIVGAGTAGLTLARELSSEKFRVAILESGGLKPDKATQNLGWGEIVGHPDHPLDTARPRYLGGSSNRWHIAIGDSCEGVRMRPLDKIDFEERDWIPYSGWPFGKAHLDPYYERAQSICRIEPSTYKLEDWEDPELAPRLPFKGNSINTVIFKFGSRYPIIKDCAEQVKNADNIGIYLYANVVEIEKDPRAQMVTHLRVACLNGNGFRISAKIFILAAGGIEIPRLLLLSNRIQREGLGNNHDLVGRFFMQHLHFFPSGIFVPENTDIFHSTALYRQIRFVSNVPVIGKLALSEEVLRRKRLLNYVAELYPTVVLRASLYKYPKINCEGLRSIRIIKSTILQGRLPDNFGTHFKKIMADFHYLRRIIYRHFKSKAFGMYKNKIRIFRLANMSEQLPNPDSRVTLSNDRDSLGLKRVQLDWRLSPYDIESAIESQKILDEELRRSGLGKLYIQLDEDTISTIHGGWHHMGTTRMHIDPRKGVVDEDCRVHGISNLYIAGPSVFPTGGYTNPSLTIVALSIRLADHLKKLMPQGES